MRSTRTKDLFRIAVVSPALLWLCTVAGVLGFGAAGTRADPLRLACPSASQCTALGSEGQEVTFNPSAPGTPTQTTIDASAGLEQVACPSVAQCTAFAEGGRELTFDPSAPGTPSSATIDGSSELRAAACPSVSQCTAVDQGGREVTFDPNAPGEPTAVMVDPPSPGPPSPPAFELSGTSESRVTGIACASRSQCTAVDSAGREVTFDPSAPGAPTPVLIDPPSFIGLMQGWSATTGVTCPSAAQCTAVDSSGSEVTFNPSAPGTPTRTPITVDSVFFGGVGAVACSLISQCTAIEEGPYAREDTFDPSAPGEPTPTSIDSVATLDAVACPSVSQCTVLDSEGGEVTFDPTATGSATRAVILSNGSQPGGGSRPSDGSEPSSGSPPTDKAQVSHLRIRRARASVRVACEGIAPPDCSVTLTLTAIEKIKDGRVLSVSTSSSKGHEANREDVMLGVARAAVPIGHSRTLSISLNAAGKHLLAHRHRLRVTLTVSQAGQLVLSRAITLTA